MCVDVCVDVCVCVCVCVRVSVFGQIWLNQLLNTLNTRSPRNMIPADIDFRVLFHLVSQLTESHLRETVRIED